MIDIIIPAYNAHEAIKNTLYSIMIQRNVADIKVYIVNDASDKDYSEIIDFFSSYLSIKELKLKKNSGPGVARQYGIDHSDGKYIIFIDADDVFSNPYSTEILYKKINENRNIDIVCSNIKEETKYSIKIINENYVWLHGKIYRRSFLEKNNIRFNDSRENEDNGFNQLALLCGAKTSYINYDSYIWKYNEKSITRKNNHSYRYDGVFNYIYNIDWALKNGIERNADKESISDLAFMSLVFIYCIYLEFHNKNNINDLLKESYKLLEVLKKYPVPKNRKLDLLEVQLKGYYDLNTREYLLNPIINFDNFLKLVEDLGV